MREGNREAPGLKAFVQQGDGSLFPDDGCGPLLHRRKGFLALLKLNTHGLNGADIRAIFAGYTVVCIKGHSVTFFVRGQRP